MVEFIKFYNNHKGLVFRSLLPDPTNLIVTVSDGYTGLNLWRSNLTVTQNTEYWFYADIDSLEREFTIYSEDYQTLLKLYISVDGCPSIKQIDKFGILESYQYDQKDERGVSLPIYEIFLNKVYENENCYIKDNDIVFDIGGNIGIFSYYAICKNAKQIHTFEPGLQQFNSIKDNIISNFPNVIGNNCAVSKTDKPITFYLDPESSVKNSTTNPSNKFYQVNSINLEKYTKDKNLKTIDFLKIDCEGGEYDIIDSLSNEFLLNVVKKIVIELHKDLESKETNLLINKLRQNNFITNIEGDILFAWK